ncbi:hypothetical protein [Ruminococcus champanellensis]
MQPFVLACRRALEHSFVHFAERALFDVKKIGANGWIAKKTPKVFQHPLKSGWVYAILFCKRAHRAGVAVASLPMTVL